MPAYLLFWGLIEILIISQCHFFSKQINGTNLKEDDVAVSNVKIDLTRGMENPLERCMLKNLTVPNHLLTANSRLTHLSSFCMHFLIQN